MSLNSQSDDAIMLLTVSFGRSNDASKRPLSVKEWSAFVRWLDDKGSQPGNLLNDDQRHSLLIDWPEKERVASLLQRGVALGLLKEKLRRAGLWVLTRADPNYPSLLKKRLRWDSPPILFGCGNRSLLNERGIAIVGSRNATEEDLQRTTELATKAASQELTVVSGGARGVDQYAMLGSLANGGTAAGVLADGLLRAATSAKYREYLMDDKLVLVSPYNPEASFNVGNAMGRNRYIYCLSRTAIVIHCQWGKGGTWEGAQENLKNQWVSLWFNRIEDYELFSGRFGGYPLPKNMDDLTTIYEPERALQEDFYWNFLNNLKRMTKENPLKGDEIVEKSGLRKAQVYDWLNRGVNEEYVDKHTKPVRYQYRTNVQKSLML